MDRPNPATVGAATTLWIDVLSPNQLLLCVLMCIRGNITLARPEYSGVHELLKNKGLQATDGRMQKKRTTGRQLRLCGEAATKSLLRL
jgi:hypothetical protein